MSRHRFAFFRRNLHNSYYLYGDRNNAILNRMAYVFTGYNPSYIILYGFHDTYRQSTAVIRKRQRNYRMLIVLLLSYEIYIRYVLFNAYLCDQSPC